MRFLYLLILLTFFSCASKKVDEKDYSDLTKVKFTKVRSKRYTLSDDKLRVEDKNNQVAAESGELLDDLEAQDTLSKITKNCIDKDFKSAFDKVKKYSDYYSKNPIYWNIIGTCYTLKKQPKMAMLYFNKALEFKSNYAPSYNNLGVLYTSETDDRRALIAFLKSKKVTRTSLTPRLNLARLYLEYQMGSKALRELKPLLVNSSKSPIVNNVGAQAYLMLGNYKGALSLYKKIDDDLYENASYGINYALAIFLAGNKSDAQDLFEDIDKKTVVNKDYYKMIGKKIGVL